MGLRLHNFEAARQGGSGSQETQGVAKADALFGTPDVIATVEGEDIASTDAVIDRIVEIPGVVGTDSKVARWID